MINFLSTALGGLDLFSQIMANKKRLALEQAALNETRRSNMANEQLAKAGSIDANGNRVRYIEGLGFVSEPSAVTKAILDAGNREQLANLREDQPRERAAAVRMDQRSQNADTEYRKAFDKYRYGDKRTEAQDVGDEVLATIADRESAASDPNAYMQAVRSGDPNALQALYTQNGKRSSLFSAILRAKQRGRAQYLAEKNAGDQNTFGELGQLRNAADATEQSAPMMSNANEELMNRQEAAKQQLMQAIASGGAATSGMLSRMASSVQPLDLSAVAKGMISDYEANNPDPKVKELQDLLYRQKVSNAEYSLLRDKANTAKLYKQNAGAF